MRAHFKHVHLKIFSILKGTLQSNEFWPLQWPFKDSEIHRESNSQSESSFVNVTVHPLTLSYTPGSMKYDSRVSLLARTLASLCLGREPKAKVATIMVDIRFVHYWNKHLTHMLLYVVMLFMSFMVRWVAL
jgi:hypothetical protein